MQRHSVGSCHLYFRILKVFNEEEDKATVMSKVSGGKYGAGACQLFCSCARARVRPPQRLRRMQRESRKEQQAPPHLHVCLIHRVAERHHAGERAVAQAEHMAQLVDAFLSMASFEGEVGGNGSCSQLAQSTAALMAVDGSKRVYQVAGLLRRCSYLCVHRMLRAPPPSSARWGTHSHTFMAFTVGACTHSHTFMAGGWCSSWRRYVRTP